MKTSLQQSFSFYRKQIIHRIRSEHIRENPDHKGRLMLISTAYPGYWLEHLYDAIAWVKLFPEDLDLASSQVRLFLENQQEDGRLPAYLLDNELLNSIPGLCKAYTGKDAINDQAMYHRVDLVSK